MGLDLRKITETESFGNYALWEFLEKHGAETVSRPALSVPVGAFVEALKAAKRGELVLSEDTRAFIVEELKAYGPGDEECQVDLYLVDY